MKDDFIMIKWQKIIFLFALLLVLILSGCAVQQTINMPSGGERTATLVLEGY